MSCHYSIQTAVHPILAYRECWFHHATLFSGHRGVMTVKIDCWSDSDSRWSFLGPGFWFIQRVIKPQIPWSLHHSETLHTITFWFLLPWELGRLGLTLHWVTQDVVCCTLGRWPLITINRTAGISLNTEETFLASPPISNFSPDSFFFVGMNLLLRQPYCVLLWLSLMNVRGSSGI